VVGIACAIPCYDDDTYADRICNLGAFVAGIDRRALRFRQHTRSYQALSRRVAGRRNAAATSGYFASIREAIFTVSIH